MVHPLVRADLSYQVEMENDEQFLVMFDPYNYADGPIMIHAGMLEILEQCKGTSTVEQIESNLGIEPDTVDSFKLRAFLGQLSTLGFMEDGNFHHRKVRIQKEFNNASIRKPIYISAETGFDFSEAESLLLQSKVEMQDLVFRDARVRGDMGKPLAAIIPHIDFKVAPGAYAHAIELLKNVESDVFVIVGTSHYWSESPIVTTLKHFTMADVEVPTHQGAMKHIRTVLGEFDAETDIAHMPEHSIEIHVALLQIARPDRPYSIIPILVAGGIEDESDLVMYHEIAEKLKGAIQLHAPDAFWMISGDLAHIGHKFGDEQTGLELAHAIQAADKAILASLENCNTPEYVEKATLPHLEQRICGLAPTTVVLSALRPSKGQILHYDMWHEVETESAVSFGTAAFY